MDEYSIIFNKLVDKVINEEWPHNFAFKIQKEVKYDILKIVYKIFDYFEKVNFVPIERYCASAALLTSESLIEQNIKHTITVGDYSISGEMFYEVNENKLIDCLNENVRTENLAGHMWVTLDDGTIIDFTVVDSGDKIACCCFCKRNKYSYIVEDKNSKLKSVNSKLIIHHPMVVGPEYLLNAGFDMNDPMEGLQVLNYLGRLASFQQIETTI